MASCTTCGAQNKAGAKFCRGCGGALSGGTRFCPNGHVLEDHMTECPYCPRPGGFAGGPSGPAPPTVPEGHPSAAPPTRPEGVSPGNKTRPPRWFGGDKKKKRADVTLLYHEEDQPLAGWLVCLRSPSETIYKDFRLELGNNKLGRGGSSKVLINDQGISKEHALLICREDGVSRLTDMGSGNGTFLNGVNIDSEPLKAGDILKLGKTQLVFVPFEHRVEE